VLVFAGGQSRADHETERQMIEFGVRRRGGL
jgi:hypothetical protein